MSNSKRQPITGQNHLFTTPSGERSRSGDITPWQEIEGSPEAKLEALAGDNVGPHIEIAERAERLVGSMNALAHRNKLIGFDEAAIDPKNKRPIWERYIDGTPIVINRSQTKSEQLLDEAVRDFLHSTGFAALKGTGITRGQVRTKTRRYWRGFTHSIGDPEVHDELVKLRREQRKFLPGDHPYQTVKGWSDERSRKIKAERSSTVNQEPQLGPKDAAAVTPDASGVSLPERSPEIDRVYLPLARNIADSIDRQIDAHGQAEARRHDEESERILSVLKETNP